VIEAVHSSKEECGDLLPFWKLYVEQNYRGRWVRVGKFSLRNFEGRTFIVDSNGILISDATCAKKVGMAVDDVRVIMTEGSREAKLKLLKTFVEKVKDACDRIEEEGRGYALYHFETPVEAFKEDVLQGKVFDPRTGLKLSLRQAQGRPPEGGFLQDVLGGSDDYYKALEEGKLGYRVGTVVKICGNYDPILAKHHNTWAVIVRIIDPWHYEVVQERTGRRLIIRDTDVKAIVADALHDYVGIGPERHRREVIPLIRKALEGKIPIPEGQYPGWPRPPVYQAFAAALAEHGTRDFKRSVEKALRGAEKRLKWVERNRGRYEPEDYRRERGHALLWIRLYRLVLEKIEALERGEGVRLVEKRGFGPDYIKSTRCKLLQAGVPFKETDDGIYVCKDDYEKIVGATPHRNG
jgi:hypothetical protein